MNYIRKHPYQEVLDYDMYRIFQYYSTLEIRDDASVLRAINDFKTFWQENIYLVDCEEDKRAELESSTMQEIDQIFQTVLDSRVLAVSQFSNIVDTVSPAKHSSILDVGAGKYPYSSILLAEKNYPITSIDRSFFLSNKCLEKMKVNVINAYFDNKTSVDNFDFVVGRFPCTAIEHIVDRCYKSNKPYFIQLCSCNAPITEPKPRFSWQRWQSMLSTIDPNIQFYHNYAFNVDATTAQIIDIIRQLRNRRYQSATPPLRPSYAAKARFIVNSPLPTVSKLNEEELEK